MGRQISTYLGYRKQLLKARIGKRIKRQLVFFERQALTGEVDPFMERDDNSTCLPGKKDAYKDGKEHKQKRILNDYIYNLHRKLLAKKQQYQDQSYGFQKNEAETCLCRQI